MRTIFSKTPSPTRSTPPRSPLRLTFSESLMDENMEVAQSMIAKWDASDSKSYCNITSLFSAENRHESKQYLNSVENLRQAMHYFVSQNAAAAEKLVQAQRLMQMAMRRLEKEFYQILKANRDCLDPESVSTHSYSSRASPSRSSFSDFGDDSEDESIKHESASISEVERSSIAAMAELKAIADCMISAGYAKECLKIYKTVRKSIIDEALYHLGAESRLTLSQLQKMDWEVMEIKIKNWLNAAKVAVKTLFYGERILCDQVFSVSNLRESIFAEISRDSALALFGFAENVAKCKNTPEKTFRLLDLYETVSDLWPEIDSIFIFESTSAVRQTAVNAITKLAEAVRSMLTDFEMAIQKDASKSPVPSGGVHPLTRYVMNYVTFLTDYSGSLSDILADTELPASPLPQSYYGSPLATETISSPVSARLAWLILVMFCKLDSKASLYKDAALSYLFLANNLQYVVGKVRTSNLRFLLGEDWLANHEAKVHKYAANYERMGWSKVVGSIPAASTAMVEIPLDLVKAHFQRFNAAFEETYKKQSSWIIPDPKLRDEIKLSLAKRIMPVYTDFYQNYGGVGLRKQTWNESIVRFTPDDLGNYLSDLFYGDSSSGSVSSNSSRGAHSH